MNRVLLVVAIVLLAACTSTTAPQDAELPTVAQLPTLTATMPPTETTIPTVVTAVSGVVTEPPTVELSVTATLMVTPSATITDTPTPTETATPPATATDIPTADNEGLVALALMALQATVLPQSAVQTLTPTSAGVVVITPPTTTCVYMPPGGFGTLFLSNPALIQQIGCPVGAPPVTASVPSADQVFEHGEMVWLQGSPSAIYALYSTGRFQRYDDTFNASTDPFSGGETPPQGLKDPVRGFGKVWRTFTDVRGGLGWASTDESGGQAVVQVFERGQMVYLPQRGMIYILVNDPGGLAGSWQAVVGNF